MSYGLLEKDVEDISSVIAQFPQIEQAIIFGSRAKGNFKPGSDVDIAIKGTGINHEIVSGLSFILNEDLPLPYFFDIVHYEKISEPKLIQHIDRVGKVFFQQK